MIERVIENWLTNTNELGLQIPFCQLLSHKGYRVKFISRHGPGEQGKDIIALDKRNKPWAFQLKSGNISVQSWRKIRPQLEELIEIPIHFPGISKRTKHQTALVTNGQLIGDAVRGIDDFNLSYGKRGFPTLEAWVGTQLLTDFVELHGQFLPLEPKDFQRFLELFLADGTDLLPKIKFSKFLLSFMPFGKRKVAKNNLKRNIASAVLLTSYILESYRKKDNYIAVVEGWGLLASHVLALAEKFELEEKYWAGSYELVMHGIEKQLENFKDEILDRDHFVEGDGLFDGWIFYRSRMTITLGHLAAFELYKMLKIKKKISDANVLRILRERFKEMYLWGESAVPMYLLVSLYLELNGNQSEAETILSLLVQAIINENYPYKEEEGMPNPYYDVETILDYKVDILKSYTIEARKLIDIGNLTDESFLGSSYSLETLIEMLARRMRRQLLNRLWRDITYIQFNELVPKLKWENYLWEAKSGKLTTRKASKPESWASLFERAKNRTPKSVPAYLEKKAEFLPLFLLIYPHRLRPDTVKLLEDALTF
ncbi:MAG: hypothetical protein RX316_02330 [bacterium]|nr:hypothetical protein [bacterium]